MEKTNQNQRKINKQPTKTTATKKTTPTQNTKHGKQSKTKRKQAN